MASQEPLYKEEWCVMLPVTSLSDPTSLLGSLCFAFKGPWKVRKKSGMKKGREESKTYLRKQEKIKMPNVVEEKERINCVCELYVSRG